MGMGEQETLAGEAGAPSAEQSPSFRARGRGPATGQAPGAGRRASAAELAKRYVPFLMVMAVLLALVAEAPTTRLSASGVSGSAGRRSAQAGSSTGSTAAGPVSAAAGGAAGAAAAGGTTATDDVAVSGVKCGLGVLQVTWSPYAPPCQPAWSGNNGGATAPGVSGSTITIAYREEGESSDVNAVRSIMPGVLPTDSQVLYDLNVFLQAFNKEYELYGRHVVIKPFMAQGDAMEEMVGEDTQGAQEDAATAASMGAFADITPIPTIPYSEALVQNHVISMNNLLTSNSFLQSSAPYAYSMIPSLDDLGSLMTTIGCNLGSSPVSFADDSSLNGKPRVFGAILLENPQYQGLENEMLAGLQACGVKVPVVINYTLDLSTIQQQMQNAISQMKSNNVTTVLCGCDPVGEIYVTQAADQQDFGPEWFSEWLPPQFERTYSQDQWAHSVEVGLGPSIPEQEDEAYKVYQMVDPGGQPQEPYFWYVYYQLLYLFNGLQAAGPDLTPASMLSGLQHLPPSQPGQVGQWTYGTGIYWPFSQAQVSYWVPNKPNAFDDKAGDYNPCFGGQWFSLLSAAGFPKTLDCPGLS
ncbi:MAG TPA: hypothetical protein VK428_07710 [Acidimicrobiales bacterium]|nr:hypothetical protein [Acidimicrobiales bacterium]